MRFRKEHDVVDEAVREGEAVLDAERDAEEIRDAGEQRVDDVEERRDEEKGELDRLGDAGEERRERGGDHDAADLRAILRTRAAPHGDGRGGQTPHLEEIAAGHVAGRRIAGDEARDFAVHDLRRCSGSTKSPAWKKNGTFQTWCRPNGMSARSTTP